MKTLRALTFAAGVAALLTLGAVQVRADAERVITGELVQLSGSQFRIVGHPGTFSAPGFDVAALDGKTVEVDIGPGGKVTQVTPRTVPINPVAHGWSSVRGQLAVVDPLSGKFTFAGDNEMYLAPSGVNISAYANQMVEAKIDENGRVTELQPFAAMPRQAGNPPAIVASACSYSGQTYSAGAAVCQSGTQYRCDGTHWQSLGVPCRVGAADAPAAPVGAPRSCSIGDATVANGSSVCRSGATHRCDDGTWINLGTPCR